MVYVILQRHYTAFANVRLAVFSRDTGEPGELRLPMRGHLQHRAYQPTESYKYTGVAVHMIDINRTRRYGCEVRILTYDSYEYWLRFPSGADCIIFSRMLRHRLDRVMEGEYDSDEQDYWEEGGWSLNDVRPEPEECPCHCHLVVVRYNRTQLCETTD